MQKNLTWLLLLALVTLTRLAPAADSAGLGDAAFNQLADEYLTGYLRWRPLAAPSLVLHEYEGKPPNFTRVPLALELTRLKSFARRLGEVNTTQLSRPAFYDFRILRGALNREIFAFEK